MAWQNYVIQIIIGGIIGLAFWQFKRSVDREATAQREKDIDRQAQADREAAAQKEVNLEFRKQLEAIAAQISALTGSVNAFQLIVARDYATASSLGDAEGKNILAHGRIHSSIEDMGKAMQAKYDTLSKEKADWGEVVKLRDTVHMLDKTKVDRADMSKVDDRLAKLVADIAEVSTIQSRCTHCSGK